MRSHEARRACFVTVDHKGHNKSRQCLLCGGKALQNGEAVKLHNSYYHSGTKNVSIYSR